MGKLVILLLVVLMCGGLSGCAFLDSLKSDAEALEECAIDQYLLVPEDLGMSSAKNLAVG
ncbi:MAG: hypothetical protein J7K75_03795 [Desulfuromonas sp.]|nr:hypothetical protein [Desulfuromonas sp.]